MLLIIRSELKSQFDLIPPCGDSAHGNSICYGYAVRWDHISANPFTDVKLVFVPETTPSHFSREELQKLLEKIGDHWIREVVIFSVVTGLRRGEILNLKWGDIRTEQKTAEIVSSKTYRVKAGKRRLVPLNDTALKVLERQAEIACGDFVFHRNGMHAGMDCVTQRFKKFVRRSGINPRLHVHSLRHTFGTWLAQDHVSIYEIQKLLGHSDISMTQIYSHLVASELHEAVNRISLDGVRP